MFQSKEEKAQARQDKADAKVQAILDAYGLDFDSYTDDQLDEYDKQNVRAVSSELSGSGMYTLGSLMSGHGDTAFIMSLLKAQIDQNWILIRQNERIIRILENEK